MQKYLKKLRAWRPTKKQIAITAGVIIVAQLLYPGNYLLPLANIDNLSAGGWKKQDVAWELNHRIADTQIPVHRGNEKSVYLSAKPSEIGISTDTTAAVEQISYPWYLRIVPTSALWYGIFQQPNQYDYTYQEDTASKFITKQLDKCQLVPQDATLEYKDSKLQLVAAKNGGTCKSSDVLTAIKALTPTMSTPASLTFKATITSPKISDKEANKVKTSLEKQTASGISLIVLEESETIPQAEVLSWLRFTPTADTLTYAIDPKAFDGYFAQSIAKKIAITPGTSQVTTRDFTEVSRVDGKQGRTLNADETRASIMTVLTGKQKKATAATSLVLPKVNYSRSYSKTVIGIRAYITHYAEDHAGDFGISFAEIGGSGRAAEYNGGRVFTTASTYKLFVAYGTLKKVESGEWKWSDTNIASGRDRASCFDDMIVKSDNACAEAMLKALGYTALTNDIRGLGLSQSGFTGSTPQTTANDLRLFLSKLEQKQLPLKDESRSRLLEAMKRNVYRQGIPSGASGSVADKVGFLDGLLHDAAIVYSPSGTYVLTILSNGSSWAAIAEITRGIESLR